MVKGVFGMNGRMYLLNTLYHDNLRRLLGPSLHQRGTSVSDALRLRRLRRNEDDSNSVSSSSDEHDETSSSCAYRGDGARDGTGVLEALEHSEAVDWL